MPFRGSLQDIRLFIAAYEERSFTAAASRENATQSGVSHHIRQLEMLLDVKLFVREKVGVTATPAADIFYRCCIETLRGIDDATNRVIHFAKGQQGSFTVGIFPALTRRITAPALLRFAQMNPNVKVRVIESTGTLLPPMISSGEIDFGIGRSTGGEAGISARQLMITPECLVSRTVPSANGTVAPLAEGAIKMVWPTLTEGRRPAVVDFFNAHEVSIESDIEIDSALAALDLVARSDWKTVAPCLAIDPVADANRYSVHPLRGPDVDCPLMLLERTGSVLTPASAAFVEVLVEEAMKANTVWLAEFASAGLL